MRESPLGKIKLCRDAEHCAQHSSKFLALSITSGIQNVGEMKASTSKVSSDSVVKRQKKKSIACVSGLHASDLLMPSPAVADVIPRKSNAPVDSLVLNVETPAVLPSVSTSVVIGRSKFMRGNVDLVPACATWLI